MKSKILKNRWFTPLSINFVGIILGLISMAFGYVCSRLFIDERHTIIDFIYGVGGSFIVGAILNILSELKIGNLLIQTVMNAIYETAASARRIRYKQSIKFIIRDIFKSTTGKRYFKLDCEHTYTIYRTVAFERKIDIDTFNGLNISTESNDSLSDENKTKFEEVIIDRLSSTSGVERFSFSNPEHKKKHFKFDEYGQPCFVHDGIEIGSGEIGIQVLYKISNAHYLESQHPWYFQELSKGLDIIIENKTNYPNNRFSLIINHPNREEIESDNKKYIDDDGRLKDGNPYIQIKTDLIFLPYQGFSLKWNLKEYEEK